MASRRSLNGSMTIVGDIAQATGQHAPADWSDVLRHLPDRRPSRVVELTVGYRIPEQIMVLASRVLRAFCDQFALVLERDRLLDAATEAEAYRRTEHIRRSLLAAVSHDLRSPLAAIKASVTDLLGQDVGGLRLPLVEASEEERTQIRDCLERLGVFEQASV